MKITDAKVFVGGPGKNYVTLKIHTDQGVFGLGDATKVDSISVTWPSGNSQTIEGPLDVNQTVEITEAGS